jgi:hypothetical protein
MYRTTTFVIHDVQAHPSPLQTSHTFWIEEALGVLCQRAGMGAPLGPKEHDEERRRRRQASADLLSKQVSKHAHRKTWPAAEETMGIMGSLLSDNGGPQKSRDELCCQAQMEKDA